MSDHHGGLLERGRRFVLSLGRDDFGPGLARRLRLGGHGPLQLHGQADVLTAKTPGKNRIICINKAAATATTADGEKANNSHFNALDFDAPRFGCLVESGLFDRERESNRSPVCYTDSKAGRMQNGEARDFVGARLALSPSK